jgi:hypothetical protein
MARMRASLWILGRAEPLCTRREVEEDADDERAGRRYESH